MTVTNFWKAIYTVTVVLTAIGCQLAHCFSTVGYSIIGKSVILLVNINYLQVQVVLTTRRCKMTQIDRLLPWLMDFQLTTNCWLFMVRNIIYHSQKHQDHFFQCNCEERFPLGSNRAQRSYCKWGIECLVWS